MENPSPKVSIKTQIEHLLQSHFEPEHLIVLNESHKHKGKEGRETHMKVLIVSKLFEGLKAVERQKRVYAALDHLFKEGLHALEMTSRTPSEWEQNPHLPDSPKCAGGGASS